MGYAATRLSGGTTVAAIAVANASGDVIDDGKVVGGPHSERGELLRTVELMEDMPQLPEWAMRPGQSTTLACVCTDATLDKRGCGVVARVASAGIARAVDPAFTPLDGDVVFCLASGGGPPPAPGSRRVMVAHRSGRDGRDLVAAAIRDAVRQAGASAPPSSAASPE